MEQVEPDGSDESNYIKGALNSNFTFSPPSQESSEEDSVDLGEGKFHLRRLSTSYGPNLKRARGDFIDKVLFIAVFSFSYDTIQNLEIR